MKNFRFKKKGNEYLLTNDSGNWEFITKEEYSQLNNLSETSELYGRLEKKGLIITEKNKEQIVEDLREKKGFLFQGPGLHILILTLRCNEHCVYCHASSKDLKEKQYDMTKEIAEDVVKRIFESNNQKLCIEFQGGEPLVNFEVLKLVVEKAKELSKGKEVLFRIVTNLELMNKDKLNFLIENNFDICTSLDGPKELHNKNRGGYEKVIEWITKINEEYKNSLDRLAKKPKVSF